MSRHAPALARRYPAQRDRLADRGIDARAADHCRECCALPTAQERGESMDLRAKISGGIAGIIEDEFGTRSF
jgi:hypothetical protein